MPRNNAPPPAPRTRHAQLTSEAFRELAERAVEELYENADTFEVQDLRGWSRALVRRIGEISDHAESGADLQDGLGGMRLCDALGN